VTQILQTKRLLLAVPAKEVVHRWIPSFAIVFCFPMASSFTTSLSLDLFLT
jgi:hypothetical protein